MDLKVWVCLSGSHLTISVCQTTHRLRPRPREGQINLRVIPCARMKTLPLRLSFPFDSTDRPRLKIDFHFLDFPENFLLTNKRQLEKPTIFEVLSAVLKSQDLKSLTCLICLSRCDRAWRCWYQADCSHADALYAGGGLGLRSGPGPPPGSSVSSAHPVHWWGVLHTSPHTSNFVL